jgi:hypothetical protein
MNRLELFKEALAQTNKLRAAPFKSISLQLNYLIDLEEGRCSDRDRLNDIIIGIQTVREVEPVDANIASWLYRVVEKVEEMKKYPTS